MTELTDAARNALPDSAFGLPDRRAFPMPDAGHARNALARASEAYRKGTLTSAEKAQIDRMAHRLLGTGEPGEPVSTG